MNKKFFSDIEIDIIKTEYVVNNKSCDAIALLVGVSKGPIIKILKENGILKKSKSNGVKIILSEKEKNNIKDLYLNNNKNCVEIAKELGLTNYFIDKYLCSVDYRRTKGDANSLYRTGKKLSKNIKDNMSLAQQKLAKSGKRKQTGGVCKTYIINGLECQGTYEKFYLEKLINDNIILPYKSESINTPYGVYYPDFTYGDRLIEIKSDYTYDILVGDKISRFTKKISTLQYDKIKWINNNIKPIEILIIDKRNNKIIKKEI